ncbi:MAG: chorismate-binding protein [Phycisphaerales bacterium]|nr:chorismate-binding protein [Phycisphaerales bacterium]
MPNLSVSEYGSLVSEARRTGPAGATIAVPLVESLLADQLTPVLAYRRLVAPDQRTAPSFLLESVEGGERQGRYSILGAQPIHDVVAYANKVTARDLASGSTRVITHAGADPLDAMRRASSGITLVTPPSRGPRHGLPACFLGGWVGFAGYDTVRYAEPDKLGWQTAPKDDRNLPDLHFAFYDGVVVFDHVDKLVHIVQLAMVAPGEDPHAANARTIAKLERRIDEIQRHTKPLPAGRVPRETPVTPLPSNMTREQHASMLAKAMEYIRAGDIFQVVLGQRFERASTVDPFDVYRSLRAVNPSPYMVYLQAEGCILVASSPEILCRVRSQRSHGGAALQNGGLDPAPSSPPLPIAHCPLPAPGFIVTNRPLAGTRKRGSTPEEDLALERELLADEKERAEHIMLVDLGRNDVGRVAVPGSIALPAVMEIERYSHVMHISSTVTGQLREGLDCWDALRAALPVGTISGAPKIRAMQIIDELEPLRRGPYGGGMGYVGLDGQMDIALTLRTMVVPTDRRRPDGTWTYHLQASGGIVADSKPEPEFMETINKAAALARAIDLAERAFTA